MVSKQRVWFRAGGEGAPGGKSRLGVAGGNWAMAKGIPGNFQPKLGPFNQKNTRKALPNGALPNVSFLGGYQYHNDELLLLLG